MTKSALPTAAAHGGDVTSEEAAQERGRVIADLIVDDLIVDAIDLSETSGN